MHIQDIPQTFVPPLAKLLQFRPNEDREALAQRLTKGAKSLPSGLRSSRLENFLLPPRGQCQLHKCIHYDVVQAVLHQVQLEVGYRLNNVISESEVLSPEQYSRVMRLRELHALWLDRSQYRKTFKSRVQDLKWKYQADQCGACILSQITSDLQILLDLRCAFRSRATRAFEAKYGNPRLQQWVYVWIATLASFVEEATDIDIDLDAVLLQNEHEAIALKKLRAQVAAKKQLDKYRRGETLDGAYVTEVPYDFSYPIRFAPHQPKSQASLTAQETHEVQAENFVGDADEAHLEGMDPYEALTSITYLPSTANSQQVKHSAVSADHSTKGHNTCPTPKSARNSTATISIMLDDRSNVTTEGDGYSTREAVEEYIPPRSQWTTPLPQEAAMASSTLLPNPMINQSRPTSVTSNNSWERSNISSQSSWQTEICKPNDASSSIYSSPGQNTYMSPSQSWQTLSRVAQEQAKSRNTTRKQWQAESYANLIPESPFSDSSSTSHAPRDQQIETRKPNQVGSPTKGSTRSPGSESVLFLNLWNEVSRPVSPGTSIRTCHRNSSATTLRQADVTPSAKSPPDTPSTRRASGAPRAMSIASNATDTFTRLYSEILEDYMYVPGATSAGSSTSTLTKDKLTPAGISPKACPTQTQRQTQHDDEINPIVADITCGKNLDGCDEDERSRKSYRTRGPTPSLVSDSTHSGDSPGSVSTRRRRSSMKSGHSRQTGGGEGRIKYHSRSNENQHTTWSGGYQNQVQNREDLGWYYGMDKDREE